MIIQLTLSLSLSILALTAASAGNKGPFTWPIIKVTDGDTIQVNPEWIPEGLKLAIRVKGVDTPEKAPRALCQEEANLGNQASSFTKEWVIKNKDKIHFDNIEWDKYGGRMLADVYSGSESLAKSLIANGLAREYWGDKKKSWCD